VEDLHLVFHPLVSYHPESHHLVCHPLTMMIPMGQILAAAAAESVLRLTKNLDRMSCGSETLVLDGGNPRMQTVLD
jgi:hypothetical protein